MKPYFSSIKKRSTKILTAIVASLLLGFYINGDAKT